MFYVKVFALFSACWINCKRMYSYQYSEDAKEIIHNVHYFCKQEKEDELKISLNQAKERTSTMTGVSKSTIERLMKRDKTKEEKPKLPRK